MTCEFRRAPLDRGLLHALTEWVGSGNRAETGFARAVDRMAQYTWWAPPGRRAVTRLQTPMLWAMMPAARHRSTCGFRAAGRASRCRWSQTAPRPHETVRTGPDRSRSPRPTA